MDFGDDNEYAEGPGPTDTGNFSSALANLLNAVSKYDRRVTGDVKENVAEKAGDGDLGAVTEQPCTSNATVENAQISGDTESNSDYDSSDDDDSTSESSEFENTDDIPLFTHMDLDGMLKKATQRVNLQKFFKPGEFEALSKFEKYRVRKLENKCTLLLELGLPMPPEDILREKMGLDLKNKPGIDSSDSESGDDWAPSGKAKNRKLPKFRGISAEDTALKMKFIEKYVEDRQSGKIPERPTTSKVIEPRPIPTYIVSERRKAIFEPFKKAKENDPPRYNTRPKTGMKYTEEYTPEDDDFVYCDECDKIYEDDCPDHPATRMMDCIVKMDAIRRAKRTCPPGLNVDPSQIRKAGLGVWCDTQIAKNTVFGPYEGEIIKIYDLKKLPRVADGGYSWEIYKKGKLSHYIDGSDETKSNWMRYVNCARNEEEQNLIAFQYKGQVYYRAFKPIKQCVEMFVWYGTRYAAQIGISAKPDGEVLLALPFNSNKNSNNKNEKGKASAHESHEMDRSNDSAASNEYRPVVANGFASKSPLEVKDFNYGDRGTESTVKKNVGKAQCPRCLKYYCNEYKLQQHIELIHEKRTGHSCSYCGKPFSSKLSLQQHIRTHTGEKPYKCKECGDSFTQSSSLKLHLRIHSGEKPYKCKECGDSFSRSSSLKLHLRIHSGEKPYKCKECGASFTQSSSLKLHLRIHSGQKPYKCEECGDSFTQKGQLKSHLRIHSGEKPYKCKECGDSFTRSSSLKLHLRIHSGEKPYKCDECGDGFADASTLRKHLRIHSGEKPYKCDVCGRRFARSCNLKQHTKSHTGMKTYKCGFCEERFDYKRELNRHVRDEHEEGTVKSPA